MRCRVVSHGAPIGVHLLSSEDGTRVVIEQVEADGPGHLAGLRTHDQIVSIHGRSIGEGPGADLQSVLAVARGAEAVTWEVRRARACPVHSEVRPTGEKAATGMPTALEAVHALPTPENKATELVETEPAGRWAGSTPAAISMTAALEVDWHRKLTRATKEQLRCTVADNVKQLAALQARQTQANARLLAAVTIAKYWRLRRTTTAHKDALAVLRQFCSQVGCFPCVFAPLILAPVLTDILPLLLRSKWKSHSSRAANLQPSENKWPSSTRPRALRSKSGCALLLPWRSGLMKPVRPQRRRRRRGLKSDMICKQHGMKNDRAFRRQLLPSRRVRYRRGMKSGRSCRQQLRSSRRWLHARPTSSGRKCKICRIRCAGKERAQIRKRPPFRGSTRQQSSSSS